MINPKNVTHCNAFRAGHYDCIQNMHSYTNISRAHVLKPADIRETVNGKL